MATLSQITMPNNTTHDILRNAFFGTCSTAAATADKVVTLSDAAGWSLKTGTIIGVKFTNSNSASSCTLNVNDSGAKSVWYDDAVYTGNDINICGSAGRTNYYMYDGTYWVWMNCGTIENAELKTAIDQFSTINGGLLQKCVIDLVPVQSGSGDPYPAGGWKNRLPLDITTIKSINTSGTWTGNNYVINGITYAVQVDSANNVLGIKVTGTASAEAILYICINPLFVEGTSYILSGAPASGSNTTYRLQYSNNVNLAYNDYGNGVTFEDFDHETYQNRSAKIIVSSGYAIPTAGLQFYPMIRLSTETDPTFAPYSNVRPISGHTEVDLKVVGKNKLDISGFSTTTNSGVTLTPNGDGTVKTIGTATATSAVVVGTVSTNGSYILNGCPSGGSIDSYRIDIRRNGTVVASDYGNGTNTLELQAGDTVNVRFANGYAFPSGGLIFKPMIRLASESDSTFEPYLGHLYQVQIGSTVYGGTDEMVSGNLSDDTACDIYNGTETGWSTRTTAGGFRLFERALSTNIIAQSSQVGLCNELKWKLNLDEEYTYRIYGSPSTLSVRIGSSASSLQDFYDWLDANNLQITYPRATAVAISHTPQQIETLAGQNNLSTPLDGQSIETNGVEYKELFTFDDVEKVVSLRVPISMLGTDESGRTTASQAYASGDYFYKDGKMGKALTSISQGATFTLNTNYSSLTLAEILKAIENA